MSIKPSDFYDFARDLHSGKDDKGEACHRTVAGRFYYAAFLAIREVVRTNTADPAYDFKHTQLAGTLTADADPDVREMGQRVDALRKLRSKSDYRTASTVSKMEVSLREADVKAVLRTLPTIQAKIPKPPRKA